MLLPHLCTCVCACACTCGFNSLGYIPRSRISELYDDSLLYILRNCQTISKASTPFYIPTSNLWGFQFLHIPVNTSYCLFCPVDVCEGVPHGGFDLHFSNDWWCWVSFYILIGHLYIFFGGTKRNLNLSSIL